MRSPRVLSTRIPTPLGDLQVDGATVAWSVVTVVGTYVVARLAAAAALRLAHRVQGVPDDLALQASRVVRYFVIVVGVGVELSVLGAPVQPVLAAVLVVGAAVFLMLRGIADNFGAGLVLQARRPLRIGDLVESHGYLGYVRDLNSRSVVLETQDGRSVHIPNHRLMDEAFVNHSSRGRARSDLELRALTLDPDGLARRVAEVVRRVPGVLRSPGPRVLVAAVDDRRARLLVRVWHAPGVGPLVCSRVASSSHRALAADGVAVSVRWPPPPVVLPAPYGDL